MEDIDGGLHPAVDEQSQGETGKQQTDDNGRHWWRATSYSGWTKPRWKVKQESNKQKAMEDIDGGLHPAVDEQSQGETGKQQTDDNGRHWWRATSYSGWTKPRWKVKQESNKQKAMEDIDGGLHPAVDEQSQGERCERWNCAGYSAGALCYKVSTRTDWSHIRTASLAEWLRRRPQEWKTQGSIPTCVGIFQGWIIPSTLKLALQWLPYHAPGVLGSALGLVGPVSVYCD